MSYDQVTGATRSLYHRTGYLGTHQAGDALDIALAHVGENLPLLGLGVLSTDSITGSSRSWRGEPAL